jgi:hypothetical protein
MARIENLLQTPNLIGPKYGTMNKQEPAIIFLEPDLRLVVAFENNPLYDKHHFISSYQISEPAVKEFIRTDNIGQSREMRIAKLDQNRKLKAAQEEIRKNEKLFYQSLPADARMSSKQLHEVENFKP